MKRFQGWLLPSVGLLRMGLPPGNAPIPLVLPAPPVLAPVKAEPQEHGRKEEAPALSELESKFCTVLPASFPDTETQLGGSRDCNLRRDCGEGGGEQGGPSTEGIWARGLDLEGQHLAGGKGAAPGPPPPWPVPRGGLPRVRVLVQVRWVGALGSRRGSEAQGLGEGAPESTPCTHPPQTPGGSRLGREWGVLGRSVSSLLVVVTQASSGQAASLWEHPSHCKGHAEQ